MTLDETVPESDHSLPADAPGTHVRFLGMSEGLHGVHGNGGTAGHAGEGSSMKGSLEEDHAMNAGSSPEAFKEYLTCPQTSKSSKPPGEKPECMAVVPHVPQRLSMQMLRERLKDKLKEKLKPKLMRNLKHRQELSLQVVPWVSSQEVAQTSKEEPLQVAHDVQGGSLESNVSPLKALPAGVKTEPELDVPSPFFALGKETAGQIVVSNGRKRNGKGQPLSRVNRFAESILQFIGERSVPEKLIRGALGNNPDISKAIRLLLSEKRLKRLGDGGKGCAYVYVRTDLMETKPKMKELDQVDVNAQAMTIEREFVRELERRFPAANKLDPFVWNRCGRMQGDHLQCDV